MCTNKFFFFISQQYDIIHGMKTKILPFVVMMLALAGCRSASDEMYSETDIAGECIGNDCAVVRYASPNGNDLVLETKKHVIEIQAQSGTPYSYYVWTGGKGTSDDPDLIVSDGDAMVLVEE